MTQKLSQSYALTTGKKRFAIKESEENIKRYLHAITDIKKRTNLKNFEKILTGSQQPSSVEVIRVSTQLKQQAVIKSDLYDGTSFQFICFQAHYLRIIIRTAFSRFTIMIILHHSLVHSTYFTQENQSWFSPKLEKRPTFLAKIVKCLRLLIC